MDKVSEDINKFFPDPIRSGMYRPDAQESGQPSWRTVTVALVRQSTKKMWLLKLLRIHQRVDWKFDSGEMDGF